MHAEKREGQGRQNNGGTFPGSQANSGSSLNMFQKLLSFSCAHLKLHPKTYLLSCLHFIAGSSGQCYSERSDS